MNKILFGLVCTLFIIAFVHIAHADDENNFEARDPQQFLQDRLFGLLFPRKQLRETKEKYEERCERAVGINKVTDVQRWCPKLEEWDEWRKTTSTDQPRG
ncbi:unnamed protein product [Adineta ricciae]|uniref:Uncharacterized protein n=1 Tax=Adineta ricciae TaxID=249248 RepID=A0A815RR40_ADIRI|nr:unnamed protein product [Adineta ricciae]